MRENAPVRKLLDKTITAREIIFLAAVTLCVASPVSPPLALLLGIAVAWCIGHPYLHLNHKATHILLQLSVVGLGFGMNAGTALQAGKEGILFTIASIAGTLALGFVVARIMKINGKTGFLISAGTAICGGSAIAAAAPVINAKEGQISVALGVVFILNAVALFLFPAIGHALHLSETQFGLWSAIAIHDTSSVVGAAGRYGHQALETATTVKLARALWIIPVTGLSAFIFKTGRGKVKIPWFIGLFVAAVAINTYIPAVQPLSGYCVHFAKAGLTLTLFLIGSGLSREVLQSVGIKPLLLGILLWMAISAAALWAVISWA